MLMNSIALTCPPPRKQSYRIFFHSMITSAHAICARFKSLSACAKDIGRVAFPLVFALAWASSPLTLASWMSKNHLDALGSCTVSAGFRNQFPKSGSWPLVQSPLHKRLSAPGVGMKGFGGEAR
jgi:hypothetical protein